MGTENHANENGRPRLSDPAVVRLLSIAPSVAEKWTESFDTERQGSVTVGRNTKRRLAEGDEEEGTSEVYVYGPIVDEGLRWWFGSGTSSEKFRDDLAAATPKNGRVTVRINSPGGYVDEAAAIYQQIVDYREENGVDVKIDGMAASAASLVALAGENIGISRLGTVFIHRPWQYAVGHASNMEAAKASLESAESAMATIYDEAMKFEGSDWEDSTELMSGIDGEGTWLNAEDALALEFVDEVLKAPSSSSASVQSTSEAVATLAGMSSQRMMAAALESEDEELEDDNDEFENEETENDEEDVSASTEEEESVDEVDEANEDEQESTEGESEESEDGESGDDDLESKESSSQENSQVGIIKPPASNQAGQPGEGNAMPENDREGATAVEQPQRDDVMFNTVAELAARVGVPNAHAEALTAIAQGETPQTFAERLSNITVQKNPHQKNLQEAAAKRGNKYSLEKMVNFIAAKATESASSIRNAEADAAIEVDFARNYNAEHLPPLLQGNGELVPTSAMVGDPNVIMSKDSGKLFAATDSFSLEDSIAVDVDYAGYLEALIPRTPILEYIRRRPITGGVVHIPRVSSPPVVTEKNLGINTGQNEAAELQDPTPTDITIDHVPLAPNALALNIKVGRPAVILTDGWLNETVRTTILDQFASEIEEAVIQGAQGISGGNAGAISNSQYDATDTAGAIAIREILLNARGSVRKANVPIMGSAFAMGSDIYDHLAARPTGSGGGVDIIRDGMIDTIPCIPTNHLADGSSSNQSKHVQVVYGAWNHSTLGLWDVTRMWTSDEETMRMHVHALSLYIWKEHYPQAFTNVTVTNA